MTDALPAEAQDLPPAAKHIYHYLDRDDVDARTHTELVDALSYNPDTVTRNLGLLMDADLATASLHPSDSRRTLYRVPDSDP